MRINVHVQAVIGAALLLFALAACEDAITPTPTEEPRRVVTVLTEEHQIKTDSPPIESGLATASASTPSTITWEIPGTLEANTINIYQMTVNQAGRLTARTTGSSGPDTYGYIKDPEGTTLAEDDDGGGGNNFMVTAQVGAGSYHIWVKGASAGITGRYVLRVDFTAGGTSPPADGDDHGNTRSAATRVATGSTTAGTLTAGDVDYFAITVSQSGTLTVNTSGSTDTHGTLENASGGTLATDDDGGSGSNFRASASVGAGTYYVKVRGYSGSTAGDYQLHVTFAASGETPPTPPDGDDHGNTRSAATRVATGSTTAGTLTAGDVDYFAVTVSQSGTLTVNTSGSTDTHGTLENASGGTLATDDDGGSGSNFRVSASVGGGTYYVKVRGYSGSTTGDYQLHVAFTPSDTPPPALTGAKVYWSGDERLVRANLDGSNREIVMQEPARAIAFHGGKMYWVAGARIQRADLDGSNREVVISGLDWPFPRALALYGGKMYWVAGARIQRANLDGSNREVVLVLGSDFFIPSIAFHDGKMYWTSWTEDSSGSVTGGGRIERANLDGSNREVVIAPRPREPLALPRSLAFHGGKMYWQGNSGIARANPDGSNYGIFIWDGYVPIFAFHGGKIYWTSTNGFSNTMHTDFVIRANLDASNREIVITNLDERYVYVLAIAPIGAPPGPPTEDDHGNTRSAATSMAAPSSTAGTLTAGDVDYFAVTVSQSGTLTVGTSGSTDTRGTLENASGGTLATDDDGGSGNNFQVSAAVGAGTYYARVQGNSRSTTGDYRVHAAFTTVPASVEFTYRSSDDQVFQLNADGRALDDALYTIRLGAARPEVYLIATNTDSQDASARVARLDSRAATEGQGRRPFADVELPSPSQSMPPDRSGHAPPWVVEFNNNPPPLERSPGLRRSLSVQAQRAVAEGDRHVFTGGGRDGAVPATARRVVSDGSTTLVVWVADREWSATCQATTHQCMTPETVNAVAAKFLRPGAGNDIYDWLTAIFGAPWGAHPYTNILPPESASQIHVLFYDISFAGGYFYAMHNYLRSHRDNSIDSNERLMFFMDAPATASSLNWAIGTLAHEFQHMIHFYQKIVRQGGRSETWLNEMASELAVDLVADKIEIDGPRGVAHSDPTAGAGGNTQGRLPWYNLHNSKQVTEWAAPAAYSIQYALGAYLARTYGGAALFGDIVRNVQPGVAAIEAALRTQGHAISFEDVLANWAVANLLSDNPRAPFPYRYNAGRSWSTSRAGGETFRLGSINLYNYRSYGKDGTLDGPRLFPFQQFSDGVSRVPHSNAYTTLGRATGTIRLRVSADAGMRITVVVKE